MKRKESLRSKRRSLAKSARKTNSMNVVRSVPRGGTRL